MEPTCHFCGLTTKFRCLRLNDAKECTDYREVPLLADKPKPRLIGLYSPVMQSGKSTVASWLVRQHGFERVAFASTLKDMARVFLSVYAQHPADVDRMLDGDLKEQEVPGLGHSPRWVMQTLGTEWGRRSLHPEVWVNVAMAKAKKLMAEGKSVVIDDVRFPNEYRAVAELGSTWMIMRRGSQTDTPKHPSEGQLDWVGYDYVIFNNDSKSDLYRYIEEGLRLTHR